MSSSSSRADLTAAMQAAAAHLRSAADRAERGQPVDPVTARAAAVALDELAGRDAPPPEPIIAHWRDGLTHSADGTTVELVDADDPLRGIALELDVEHREALGLSLLDPGGEMDQADDERAAAVAQLTEIRRVAVRMGTQYTYQEPDGDQYERGQFHTAQRLWETLLRMERQHPIPGLGSLRAQLAVARQGAVTAPEPVVPPCRCGHDRARHDPDQCRVCPGDDERSWRHPYTATTKES